MKTDFMFIENKDKALDFEIHRDEVRLWLAAN